MWGDSALVPTLATILGPLRTDVNPLTKIYVGAVIALGASSLVGWPRATILRPCLPSRGWRRCWWLTVQASSAVRGGHSTIVDGLRHRLPRARQPPGLTLR